MKTNYLIIRFTLAVLALIVLTATVYEGWQMHCGIDNFKPEGKALKILHCFSALSNGRKILSVSTTNSSDNLDCLHGIRFLTTFWLVSVHTYMRVSGVFKNNVINPKMVDQVIHERT